jgi:carboxyl-terminal processing protease
MPRRTKRLRHTFLLGGVFALGVVAAPIVNVVGQAPQQDAGRSDIYAMLRVFGDIVERIRADYVEPVNDRQLIENALGGMLSGLDAHSSYLNVKSYRDMQVQTKGAFGGLGLEVTEEKSLIKVVSPIDDTPAFRAGMKPGDIITAIDGKTVFGLTLSEAVEKMRGPPNSRIVLTIKRQNVEKPIEVPLIREMIQIQVAKSRLEDDRIGYIRLSQFSEQADAGVKNALRNLTRQAGGKLDGVVLDLRNNPGGLLDQAVAVTSNFISQGEVVSTRARHAEDSQRWSARGADLLNGAPLVILINNGSASASEIVAGALQDHQRAVLVGTRSFGKGSVQTVIPIPNNGAIRLTTARYYTPSGRAIQAQGVSPDITVRETREDVARFGAEREADLNKALSAQGGTGSLPVPLPPRTDLPPVASQIPEKPPEDFPKFDPAKPSETDFQLRQAVVVLKSMIERKGTTAN